MSKSVGKCSILFLIVEYNLKVKMSENVVFCWSISVFIAVLQCIFVLSNLCWSTSSPGKQVVVHRCPSYAAVSRRRLPCKSFEESTFRCTAHREAAISEGVLANETYVCSKMCCCRLRTFDIFGSQRLSTAIAVNKQV